MFESKSIFTIAGKEDAEDVVDLSDGLSGELYGEKGWVKEYSIRLVLQQPK